eukprot:CAMPEP_0119125860 /NCGR_PEP_ID=MMETSP1310-20130426/4991_1 /TAXON_ID=464262 /ORGANISM="Genus nov. species nov., Strain RCC2339" /LENGTH=43 /DNA_ID= /DNA_START= /DNA_END= /DNA_ORIENTATION=
MEPFTTRSVLALKCMSTKVVTLSLDHVGGPVRGAVAVVVAEGG